MPNFTFPKSPSVAVNSSQKKESEPIGSVVFSEFASPGVIGTAKKGPAFVPISSAGVDEFSRIHGNVNLDCTGTLAASNWWVNEGGSLTYVRTLGAGNCMPRLTSGDNFGSVKNAGFVVGQQLVNTGSGRIGNNTYVYDQTTPEKATATIIISDSGGIMHGDTFTLVDAVGTSTVYIINGGVAPAAGGGSGGSATVGFLGIGGGAAGKAAAADSMAIAINATTDANYTAVSDGVERVTITQGAAGYDGNRQNNDSIGHTAVSNFVGGLGGSAGLLGRAYFLGCFMSESNGSTIFSDSGIQDLNTNAAAHPIVRGILFAPSGVTLALVNKSEGNNTPTTQGPAFGHFGTYGDGGAAIGSVYLNEGKSTFTLLLNGHKNTPESPASITTSFDPQSVLANADNINVPSYFVEKFNTDPLKIQEKGHYLYCHYDMMLTRAVVTGSGRIDEDAGANASANSQLGWEPSGFLLSSSLGRNVGSATSVSLDTVGVPNFENFEDRFSSGFTPFITSQKIEGSSKNLFRFHTLTAGDVSLGEVKITIRNIRPPNVSPTAEYSQFDVDVRDAYDTDKNPIILETFENCDLNPSSDNFISKQVGDFNIFHDFDASALDGRKTAMEGKYPWQNQYVRVEVSPEVEDGSLPPHAMPCGFRGVHHLVTSGSAVDGPILTGSLSTNAVAVRDGVSSETLSNTIQPPIPFRESLSFKKPLEGGPDGSKEFKPVVLNEEYGYLTWGVQYEKKGNVDNPNLLYQIDSSVFSHLKFFPSFQTVNQNVYVGDNQGVVDVGGCIFDADRFNNNFFTLENILVMTGSSLNDRDPKLPSPTEWPAATYQRSGVKPAKFYDSTGYPTDKFRFFDPDFDLRDEFHVTPFIKFTVPMMGGFSGLNMFDSEKYNMTNEAVRREVVDPLQYGKKDSTAAAYRKSLDILGEKQSSDVYLITAPGIRQRVVTDHAVETTEKKFDAMCILDIEKFDVSGSAITGSIQDVNLDRSIEQFESRHIQSSFAAAYFPDVEILSTVEGTPTPAIAAPLIKVPVMAPPTVSILGVIAKNDLQAGSSGSPMGPKRGQIVEAVDTELPDLLDNQISKVTNAGVNPIINKIDGIYPASQVTTLKDNTMFDRINVRRLLISIRRSIRKVARDNLFLPANTSTLVKLKMEMKNAMLAYRNAGAITRFQVIIDDASFLQRQQNIKGGLAWSDVLGTTEASGLDSAANLIRGKIILTPKRSSIAVSLDIDELEE